MAFTREQFRRFCLTSWSSHVIHFFSQSVEDSFILCYHFCSVCKGPTQDGLVTLPQVKAAVGALNICVRMRGNNRAAENDQPIRDIYGQVSLTTPSLFPKCLLSTPDKFQPAEHASMSRIIYACQPPDEFRLPRSCCLTGL